MEGGISEWRISWTTSMAGIIDRAAAKSKEMIEECSIVVLHVYNMDSLVPVDMGVARWPDCHSSFLPFQLVGHGCLIVTKTPLPLKSQLSRRHVQD